MNRKKCPNCDNQDTSFVQFAQNTNTAVKTTEKELGDGLLECRYCAECKTGIENILTVKDRTVCEPYDL